MNTKIISVAMAFMLFGGMSLLSSESNGDTVIYNRDYTVDPSFDEADPTAIADEIYVDDAGPDSSRALQVDFDTTTNPFSVAYFTNLGNSAVDPATSSNLSDYVLTFDIRADGFDIGQDDVSSQYSLTINDAVFEGTFDTTATYQTIEANLSTISTGGTFEPADFSSGSQQFRVSLLGISGRFGQDTGNLLQLDNVRVTQVAVVPEPGSLSLLALGTLLVSCRRRRA